MSGSAATFTPTCFMQASERTPESAPPMATSSATFSFTDHSAWMPFSCDSVSSTSVLGVPG